MQSFFVHALLLSLPVLLFSLSFLLSFLFFPFLAL